MKRITAIAGVAAAVAVVWAVSPLTIRSAGDDGIMILYSHQARECEDGGGCNIWSKREMQMAMQAALRAMLESARPQHRQEPNV